MVLIASAAWQPVRPALESARRRAAAPHRRPARASAPPASRLLVYGCVADLNPVAVGLAAASLLAVMARTMLTFRDNVAMLRTSREEAADRRAHRPRQPARARPRARARAAARDQRRAARARAVRPRRLQALQRHVRPPGRRRAARAPRRQPRARSCAGRGAALPHGRRRVLRAASRRAPRAPTPLVVGAAAALSEHGEGFAIGCSYGAIELPARGRRRRRGAADRRPAHVRAEERRPHVGQPPEQGRPAARARRAQPRAARPPQRRRRPRRGDRAAARQLSHDEVEQVRHAAELHDVGKVAVPDAILTKPGPLDEDEWAFIRRHTLIGERIIAAAPALTPRRRARAREPRALGRRGLPGRPRRRGDPARRPDRRGGRRVRRDDAARARTRCAAPPEARAGGAAPLCRHAVRPRGRRGVRRRVPRPRGSPPRLDPF